MLKVSSERFLRYMMMHAVLDTPGPPVKSTCRRETTGYEPRPCTAPGERNFVISPEVDNPLNDPEGKTEEAQGGTGGYRLTGLPTGTSMESMLS